MSLKRALWVVVAVGGIGLVGCNSESLTSPDASKSSSAATIVGPTWQLVTLNGAKVVAGTQITAEFTSDSRVSGASGCNRYVGGASAEAGRLTVSRLASTRMACQADGVMEQEQRYLAALEAATTFSLSGDELRVGPASNSTSLIFTAQ